MKMPRNLGHLLFGVWLVAMALTDPNCLNLGFTGLPIILGGLLIGAGVCMMLDL